LKYASQTVKVYGASLVQTWSDCPRCFWLAIFSTNGAPNSFGDTFDIADKRCANALRDQTTRAGSMLASAQNRMRMHSQGVWVESEPISFPDLRISIMLAGRYDAIVEDESNCRYLNRLQNVGARRERVIPIPSTTRRLSVLPGTSETLTTIAYSPRWISTRSAC